MESKTDGWVTILKSDQELGLGLDLFRRSCISLRGGGGGRMAARVGMAGGGCLDFDGSIT